MLMAATKLSNVLIIDDDPLQIAVLDSYLRKRGVANIWHATDGAEAKAQLSKHGVAPELIISDLNMPNFDGVEFIMHLREIRSTCALIIVSGAEKTTMASATKLASIAGVNYKGSLGKPVALMELDAMMATVESSGAT